LAYVANSSGRYPQALPGQIGVGGLPGGQGSTSAGRWAKKLRITRMCSAPIRPSRWAAGRGGGQLRRQPLTGQRPPRPEVSRFVDAPPGLGLGDAQPVGQRRTQRAAQLFLAGLRAAAARSAAVIGECGGYMALGDGLVDAVGRRHAMAGLLPLESSFAAPRLTLGYRRARLAGDGPLGRAGTAFAGHEFHYATTAEGEGGAALFECRDARGRALGGAGRQRGRVCGSFIHLIDRAEAA